ncbi:unnamed protein product [Phytophthora lilii]|uniref:Unnamed protein product n=1 Tax=Phytophthora lilii TaxID=2077276 RepID=A0A9W6TGT2_9STRA|nr:unnamed protein product [Phytophthora lilii]
MTETTMTYRFLGNTGLLVSKLSLGSWMFYDTTEPRYTADNWYKMVKTAFAHGINLFDNAENYAYGRSEEIMGSAIKRGIEDGIWSREDLVVTTKIFVGSKGFMEGGPNDQGLSRKHIVEGIKASLKRLQLDNVDVVFCHRADAFTPIEETVRAMNFVIEQGWAHYWGTSEWLASDIQEACEIADRLGLIRPVAEQPQYSVFDRNKVDFEFVDLYKKYKLGLTHVVTPVFRCAVWQRVKIADNIKPIAAELGCSLPQLAIAWCASNEHVSTVLVGASRPEQLEENLKALSFIDKITPEVKAKIDGVVNFVPTVPVADVLVTLRGRFL